MTETKNILLINLKPPYSLKPSILKLTSPQRTQSVIQCLIYEDSVNIVDLETEQSEQKPIESAVFEDLFFNSHTIIVPDGIFSKDSRVFHTDKFIDQALSVLECFYKERQGNVIIMAFEGIFGIGSAINPVFGTEWSVKFFENCRAAPTARGYEILGPNIPKAPDLTDLAYFIDAPEEEGLYCRMLASKEDFLKDFHAEDETFERLGITPTEGMDCFDAEKSWENYVRRNSGRYVICLHKGTAPGEGTVVWYGDRGQSSGMSFVFCKMLNLGVSARGLLDDKDPTDEYIQPATLMRHWELPSTMTIASVLAILLAIVAKLMGCTFE
ncbi:hypothetical protein MPSEU_000799700 [Mayamaea pseudoterrestris]|nr:hypothetical protein MPSEU_000799700 [Mayamaea pseudoterrestris]